MTLRYIDLKDDYNDYYCYYSFWFHDLLIYIYTRPTLNDNKQIYQKQNKYIKNKKNTKLHKIVCKHPNKGHI